MLQIFGSELYCLKMNIVTFYLFAYLYQHTCQKFKYDLCLTNTLPVTKMGLFSQDINKSLISAQHVYKV